LPPTSTFWVTPTLPLKNELPEVFSAPCPAGTAIVTVPVKLDSQFGRLAM
jgi:hypothetical protein